MLSADELSRAAAWFPVVGLVVGGVAAGVRALAGTVLDPAPATVLALLAAVLVTGALHEDGLADAADALNAHAGAERRLEIMRDPRLGTGGVLALAFALLLPFALLSGLDAGDFARAVLVAHVVARWALLPLTRWLPPARADGKGALVRVGDRGLVFATAVAVVVALGLGGLVAGAVALGVAALLAVSCAALAWRVLGGGTGDVLGAVAKLAEVGVLAALVAVWR